MLVRALVSLLCSSLALSITITSDASVVANHTYDYVIVGGGLAGTFVLSRTIDWLLKMM
jgi:hypothetical protein